ncbi:fumarylacetoacetate hydrolase family protein [Caenimonas terrae]|uniref:Fumarylacetoacetate hydrolase family protein n=1 Tax=Caenimonas terrae TaxID=696074 RepID=A0ABW0NDE6_9BURK
MKLVSYRKQGALHVGVVDGKGVVELPGVSDLGAALMQGVDVMAAAKAALASPAARTPLEGIEYAAPVTRPNKVVCLGLNYYDHAKEGGREKPDYPWFFYRGSSSLIAQGEPGIKPRVSDKLDYEAELAVVIGKKARHMTHENALSCVFGYSCFNDISVRDYQKKTGQWTIGKNFDGTGPFGPLLVTADELPPGATGLRIQSRLNGQVMQDANTDDMIWGVAETIVLLTECMTLEPGDVIAMGTPAGVGQARTPPVWMKDGDVVEIDIEKIGVLRTPIRNEG